MEQLVVEPSWEQSRPGNWTLTLKFDDSQLGRYAIMVAEKGKEAKIFKNKVKEIKDLKTGTYDVYIVDQQGCSKQLNLNIK